MIEELLGGLIILVAAFTKIVFWGCFKVPSIGCGGGVLGVARFAVDAALLKPTVYLEF